jgi:hypothetical protein
MRLLPHDAHFFTLLQEHTKLVVQSARLLNEAITGGTEQLQSAAARIAELEHKADSIVHDICIRLNQTFITPLDPEDIHALASRLDDVLDGIEDCAYRLSAYRISKIPESAVELCRIILLASAEIEDAIDCLSASKNVSKQAIEINRLENAADQIWRSSIQSLMTVNSDPIECVKVKEIYEYLEKTVDRCEDIADVLQNVLVKNG